MKRMETAAQATQTVHDSLQLISQKPKLSVPQQIEHMKAQGIRFSVMTEEDAAKYLEINTYYFKIKAYAKLYEKYTDNTDPDRCGKYIDLDFAYLRDLATIDSYLRKHIFQITLDIEHYLKAALLRDFNRSNEDGYGIVKDFIAQNPEHYEREFSQKRFGKACSNMVQKYAGQFSLWNIIEILNFGDFQELYKFFYMRNGTSLYPTNKKLQSGPFSYLINPVRILRNAAAHNNCLLNSLKTPYIAPDKFNRNPEVSAFLGSHGIKNRTLNTNMNKPLIHDFCVMLFLYHSIAPVSAQKHMFSELRCLFCDRFTRYKEYYQNKNTTLLSAYEFVVKVINIYCGLLDIPGLIECREAPVRNCTKS